MSMKLTTAAAPGLFFATSGERELLSSETGQERYFLRTYDILFINEAWEEKSEVKRFLQIGIFLMLTLFFGAVVTAGGSGKKEAALSAAEKWLAVVDKGNYSESWREAASYFRNAVTQEKWDQSLQAYRKPLGRLVSRKVASEAYETSLPGAPDGEYVVIRFETSFENKNQAVETVTPMLDKDGKWRVSGYFIK
jgi:hypothetical protein